MLLGKQTKCAVLIKSTYRLLYDYSVFYHYFRDLLRRGFVYPCSEFVLPYEGEIEAASQCCFQFEKISCGLKQRKHVPNSYR